MYRLQNVFMKLKRAKLIRSEETVTMLQSTCFVKDVQLIAWYLFTQNKSCCFLTYIIIHQTKINLSGFNKRNSSISVLRNKNFFWHWSKLKQFSNTILWKHFIYWCNVHVALNLKHQLIHNCNMDKINEDQTEMIITSCYISLLLYIWSKKNLDTSYKYCHQKNKN